MAKKPTSKAKPEQRNKDHQVYRSTANAPRPRVPQKVAPVSKETEKKLKALETKSKK